MKKASIIAAVLAAAVLTLGGCKAAKDKAAPAADTSAVAADTVADTVDTSAVAADTDTDTTFTDKRDGKVYRKVTIGADVWMAENLNYAKGGICYDYDTSNCAKYGCLYLGEMVVGACPAGWHIPSDTEWTALENYVGGSGTAGKKLKSTSGWKNKGNGTDDYGFSALPGGSGNAGGRYDGKFFNAGYEGFWWGDEDKYGFPGIVQHMHSNRDSVDMGSGTYKTYMFSVRCVQDKGGEQ